MLVKHNWEEQQEIRGLLGLKNEVYPISCVKFLAGGVSKSKETEYYRDSDYSCLI